MSTTAAARGVRAKAKGPCHQFVSTRREAACTGTYIGDEDLRALWADLLVATRAAAEAARCWSSEAAVWQRASEARSAAVGRPTAHAAAHVVAASSAEGRRAAHVPTHVPAHVSAHASHVPASHVAHVSAAHATSEAAAEAARPSKTVLANLDPAVEPHEAVELMDRVGRIHRRLEDDDTAPLGPPIRQRLDVGPDDAPRRTEEVLQILPADVVRQLRGGRTQAGQFQQRRSAASSRNG